MGVQYLILWIATGPVQVWISPVVDHNVSLVDGPDDSCILLLLLFSVRDDFAFLPLLRQPTQITIICSWWLFQLRIVHDNLLQVSNSLLFNPIWTLISFGILSLNWASFEYIGGFLLVRCCKLTWLSVGTCLETRLSLLLPFYGVFWLCWTSFFLISIAALGTYRLRCNSRFHFYLSIWINLIKDVPWKLK